MIRGREALPGRSSPCDLGTEPHPPPSSPSSERNGGRRVLIALATVGFVWAAAMTGPAARASAMTVPAHTTTQGADTDSDADDGSARPPLPASIHDSLSLGERLYKLVRAEEWGRARAECEGLESRASEVKWDVRGQPLGEAQLMQAVASLRRSIEKRDRGAGMVEANRVTIVAIDLAAPFAAPEPLDLARIRYELRALEIALSEGAPDFEEVRAIARQIATTWDHLRTQTDAQSARGLVSRVDRAIAALHEAISPSQLQDLPEKELRATAALDALFTR